MRAGRIRLFLFSLALLWSCTSGQDQTNGRSIDVYAAASLTTAISEIAAAFKNDSTGMEVNLNFAASSLLARQIASGAHADVYLSANPDWMNFIEKKKLLMAKTRRDLLGNSLVLVVPHTAEYRLRTLNDLRSGYVARIALADWSHVPAGLYAKQALLEAGLWEILAEKYIATLDVRAALAYVERGDVDCAIVYASDAKVSKESRLAFVLPDSLQPDIRYPVALTAGARMPESRAFLAFLTSARAKAIFSENGFLVLPDNHAE